MEEFDEIGCPHDMGDPAWCYCCTGKAAAFDEELAADERRMLGAIARKNAGMHYGVKPGVTKHKGFTKAN